jgi:hypothetical protein
MEYRTVFDIADGYQQWGMPLWGLLMTLLALGNVIDLNKSSALWWSRNFMKCKAGGYVGLGFATLWTALAFGSTYGSYYELRAAAIGGDCRVEEGIVTKFRPPADAGGKGRENFCVAETCFAYAQYTAYAGFHNTSAHGGPLRDGLHVRVTHVGNAIVKLQIAP